MSRLAEAMAAASEAEEEAVRTRAELEVSRFTACCMI